MQREFECGIKFVQILILKLLRNLRVYLFVSFLGHATSGVLM